MKRDKTGKFINNWNSQPKEGVNLSLTKTAWQLLEQQVRTSGICRSELVEHYARSLPSGCTSSADDTKVSIGEVGDRHSTASHADNDFSN